MKVSSAAIGLLGLVWPMPGEAADPLSSFNVDLAESSVSGLSSGAYMAGQLHIAFSSTLKGAAIIVGGPYGCAMGQRPRALGQCMQTTLGAPDVLTLLERARSLESEERIDPLSHLLNDRVYVFSDQDDDTVTPPVVDQAVAFYRAAGLPETSIRYVDDRPAGHAFVTEDKGNDCTRPQTAPPFSLLMVTICCA
jgi:poly(3-hydroxybutyrate) depolymerase